MILDRVKLIRRKHFRCGCRKLHLYLNGYSSQKEYAVGFKVGRDYLFKVLKNHNLLIKRKKKYLSTTYSNHGFKYYPNILKYTPMEKIKRLLVSDITYIHRGDNKFYYLSLVTDYKTRKIVGYSLAENLRAEHSLRALKIALFNIKDKEGIVHHSDKGIQYACTRYTNYLHNHKIRISMTEDSVYENAVAERINGILKQEYMIGEIDCSYVDAKRQIKEAIELYNNERLHCSIYYKTPTEYESQFYKSA